MELKITNKDQMKIFTRWFNETYKTGLVLSGGGTRGFAHLGVLKALEENGLKPDIITGVSAGAVAAAFYADGWTPEEILELLSSQRVKQYLSIGIPKQGFIKLTGFEKVLNMHLRAKNIEHLQLKIKLYAVNLNTGAYTCFDKGPLAPAVTASASIPIVFPPVKINGHHYVDGGLINNFPVEPLVGKCRRIIGVNVNPLKVVENLGSLKRVVERTFHINVRAHVKDRRKLCDLFIEPEGIGAFGMMDIKNAPIKYQLGYDATVKALQTTGWRLKKQIANP
jgi:NTE family protein